MKKDITITHQRSISREMSYFVKRWILRRPFITANLSSTGPVFKVKTEDVIGRHIYKYHAHEPEISNWLIENLDPHEGDVFIDIGANLGWYTVLFDTLAKPNSSVFAFEPDPLNCEMLRANAEMNHAHSVQVIETAVAETSGRSKLYRYSSNNLGRHSLLNTESSDFIEVDTVSLDQFWDRNHLMWRTVRVLKIDIEGYEYLALTGATEVLSRCSLVICEYDPTIIRTFGLKPEALVDLLEHAGMKPGILTDGILQPVSREILLSRVHGVNVFWRRDQAG